MTTRAKKVSRRAAVAMIGSGLGMSNALVRADQCTPTGKITVGKAMDAETNEPILKAIGPCRLMVPLVLAGGGRQKVSDEAKCEATEMLNAVESLNNTAGILREYAFVIFGLNDKLAKKLEQDFQSRVKNLK
jgi:hypothetical protein